MLKALFRSFEGIGAITSAITMNPGITQQVRFENLNFFDEPKAKQAEADKWRKMQEDFLLQEWLIKKVEEKEEERIRFEKQTNPILYEVEYKMVRGKKVYSYDRIEINWEMAKFHQHISELNDIEVIIKNKQLSNEEITLSKKDLLIQLFIVLVKNFATKNENNIANFSFEQFREMESNIDKIVSGEISIEEILIASQKLQDSLKFVEQVNLIKELELKQEIEDFNEIFQKIDIDKIILESMITRNSSGKIKSFSSKTDKVLIREAILNEVHNLSKTILTWEQEERFYLFTLSKVPFELSKIISFSNYSFEEYEKIREDFNQYLIVEIKQFLKDEEYKKEQELKRQDEERKRIEKESINAFYQQAKELEKLDIYSEFLQGYSNYLDTMKKINISLTVIAWAAAATYTALAFTSFGFTAPAAVAATIQAGILTYFTIKSVETHNEINVILNEVEKIKKQNEIVEFKTHFENLKRQIINQKLVDINTYASFGSGLSSLSVINYLVIKKISSLIAKIPSIIINKISQKIITNISLKIQQKITTTISTFAARIGFKKALLVANSWATPVSIVIGFADLISSVTDIIISRRYEFALNEIKRNL